MDRLFHRCQSMWTSPSQFERLVNLLEAKPDIARGFVTDRSDIDKFWKDTAKKLNRLGPPFKDAISWKKVWVDFKANIKEKLINNEKKKKQPGLNDYNLATFSELEEVVIKITSIDKAVLGVKASVFDDLQSTEKTNRQPGEINLPHIMAEVNDNEPVTSSKRSTIQMLKKQQKIKNKLIAAVATKLDDVISHLQKIGRSLDERNKENRRHNLEMERLQRDKFILKKNLLKLQLEAVNRMLNSG